MPVTPYLDINDPTELARFGLNPAKVTEAHLLTATMTVIAYLGYDLSVQQCENTVEVTEQNFAILPETPIITPLISVVGRLLPVQNHELRRFRSNLWASQDELFVNDLMTVGGTPKPITIPVAEVDVNPKTGRIWIPATIYMQRFAEVTVVYNAGYSVIPDQVKMAVAQVVPNLIIRPPGSVKSVKEGNVQATFTDSFIPDESKLLLDQFKRVRLGK